MEALLNDWNTLARSLRHLHLALLQRAQIDYAREHAVAEPIGPGELLMLVTRDPAFEWLRSLSELMADVDQFRDVPETARDPALRAAVRAAVEGLLTPPGNEQSTTPFAARYWSYLHVDPAVTMAHAAVRQALQSWPAAEASGGGTLDEHRRKMPRKSPP
jgi:hypothetical protein